MAWETRSVAGKISHYAGCWALMLSELTAGPGVVFSVTKSGFHRALKSHFGSGTGGRPYFLGIFGIFFFKARSGRFFRSLRHPFFTTQAPVPSKTFRRILALSKATVPAAPGPTPAPHFCLPLWVEWGPSLFANKTYL